LSVKIAASRTAVFPYAGEDLIIIRGGGDLATGIVQKFFRSGFNILILETDTPTAIRRNVSLCEAVYDGEKTVEDITCRKIETIDEIENCFKERIVPLLIDPEGKCIDKLKPKAVIDAIIAKRNLGTNKNMADITIALGPGFLAGADVDCVIETLRGNDLGRLIFSGKAKEDTKTPGEVAGESFKRVIHSPSEGIIKHKKPIGDIVKKGDVILTVDATESAENAEKPEKIDVTAPIGGVLRGIIREGIIIKEKTKIADIDPRTDINCLLISDKARCIGGAALEAYIMLARQ